MSRLFEETRNPVPSTTLSTAATTSSTSATTTGTIAHSNDELLALSSGALPRLTVKSLYTGDTAQVMELRAFSNDGSVFEGPWKTTDVAAEHPRLTPAAYRKTGNKPGKCPNERKPEDQLASDLKQKGRVRLYGINFDSDSATIRDESKPALDIVAAMLKANPDLEITIEGHTDSRSTPEHNQQLSESRANAVKAYLAGTGVDVARLTAAGFGATKPVATNDNALGLAENRRVELAKS